MNSTETNRIAELQAKQDNQRTPAEKSELATLLKKRDAGN